MMDIAIALGLVGIIVVVFLVSRMGILPRKSLPFVVAALAAVFGITLFRRYRTSKLKEDIQRQEEELKNKEKRLQELKGRFNVSDQKLQEMIAELDNQRSASEKQILRIQADNAKEKQRIDRLSGEELHEEFRKAFGTQ